MFAPPPKFSPGDKFGHKHTISLHFPVIYVPLSEGVKRERERERKKQQTNKTKKQKKASGIDSLNAGVLLVVTVSR